MRQSGKSAKVGRPRNEGGVVVESRRAGISWTDFVAKVENWKIGNWKIRNRAERILI
jgi:hypothetical protein